MATTPLCSYTLILKDCNDSSKIQNQHIGNKTTKENFSVKKSERNIEIERSKKPKNIDHNS